MGMGFSCRKNANAFFQAPIKLAQPFPAPELRTKNFTDTRISLTNTRANSLFVEIFCEFRPGNKVFQRPCRSALQPP